MIPDDGIAGRKVVVRSLRRDDFALLCGWFADPEIYAHWGGAPFAPERVEREFFDGRDDDFAPLIVEVGEVPAGYIQGWWSSDTSGGIDIVLTPWARGRAIGVDAVRTLARWLR